MSTNTRSDVIEIREVRRSGRWPSIANLCNSTLGAGVLAFADGYNSGGLVYSVLLTMVIGAVLGYMLGIIVRSSEHFQAVSYQGLIRNAMGPNLEVAASLAMFLSLYGSCVAYLIIIGDMMEPAMDEWTNSADGISDRNLLILIIAIGFCLPISLLRSLTAMASSSSLAVVALLYTSFVVVFRGIERLDDDGVASEVVAFESGTDLLKPIPLIVFGFQCHVQGSAIYAELAHPDGETTVALDASKGAEDPGDLTVPLAWSDDKQVFKRERSWKRVKEMDFVVAVAYFVCFLFYTTVGIFGYLQFADETESANGCTHDDMESNVLKCFADDDTLVNVARLAITIVGAVSYPINHFTARTIVFDLMDKFCDAFGYEHQGVIRSHGVVLNPHQRTWQWHYGVTIAFFLTALCPALLVDDLGVVFSILGSTVGVAVIFIFPGLLLLNPRGAWAIALPYGDETEGLVMKPEGGVVPLRYRILGYSLIILAVLIFVSTTLVNYVI